MTRLKDFYQDLQREKLTDDLICAGLVNVDIEKPDWVGFSEEKDYLLIWDNEEGDRHHWSAIRIEYR